MARNRTGGGVQIASVVGVPIVVMPSWFLFATYVLLIGPGLIGGGGRGYVLSGAFALMLLASVVLHEIGHCVTARAFGLPVRAITVNLLAGLTEITEPPQTPAREYAVAIAGPMVSILLCAVGVVTAAALPADGVAQALFLGVAISNGAIAGMNLLPGLPLDGGRVLRSLLWQVTKDPLRATRLSAYAGMLLAFAVVPVLVVGVLPAVGLADRDAGTVVISALLGAFIYYGANASLRRARAEARLPRLTLDALARPALAVPATLPVAEAVRRVQDSGLRALVVVDGNGRLEGIVSEAWVRQVPVERRPWVSVADGARRVEPGLLLDPALEGEALLDAMRATPASEYVVSGPVPRVLVTADVAQAMES